MARVRLRQVAAKGSVALTKAPSQKPRKRPPWTPTEQDRWTVKNGIAWGLSPELIRQQIINPDSNLPISIDALKKYFYFELQHGRETMLAAVGQSLADSAVRLRDTRAGIFVMKALGGYREDGEHEPPGSVAASKRGGVILLPSDADPESWERAAKQHQSKMATLEDESA